MICTPENESDASHKCVGLIPDKTIFVRFSCSTVHTSAWLCVYVCLYVLSLLLVIKFNAFWIMLQIECAKMSNADLLLFQIYFIYHSHWFILIVIRMISTHKLNLIKWKVHMNIVCQNGGLLWLGGYRVYSQHIFFYLFIYSINKLPETQQPLTIWYNYLWWLCQSYMYLFVRVCRVRISSFHQIYCRYRIVWILNNTALKNYLCCTVHIFPFIVEFGFVTYLISFQFTNFTYCLLLIICAYLLHQFYFLNSTMWPFSMCYLI